MHRKNGPTIAEEDQQELSSKSGAAIDA